MKPFWQAREPVSWQRQEIAVLSPHCLYHHHNLVAQSRQQFLNFFIFLFNFYLVIFLLFLCSELVTAQGGSPSNPMTRRSKPTFLLPLPYMWVTIPIAMYGKYWLRLVTLIHMLCPHYITGNSSKCSRMVLEASVNGTVPHCVFREQTSFKNWSDSGTGPQQYCSVNKGKNGTGECTNLSNICRKKNKPRRQSWFLKK